MIMTPEQFADITKVGRCNKGDVYRLITKGGYAMVGVRTPGGAWDVLAKASHWGIARYTAEKIEKNIDWEEGLMKSEAKDLLKQELEKEMKDGQWKSTDNGSMVQMKPSDSWYHPDQHLALADHLSRMAGRHKSLEQHFKNEYDKFHHEVLFPHYAQQPKDTPFSAMPEQYREERKKFNKIASGLDSQRHHHLMMSLLNTSEAGRHYAMHGLDPALTATRSKQLASLHHEYPQNIEEAHGMHPKLVTGEPVDPHQLELNFNRMHSQEDINKIPKSFNPGG